jgi:hypothetical protein
MSSTNLTINFHTHGVALTSFNSSSSLGRLFRPLAVSYDREGVEFVSVIEGRDASLPFYGVQFHPEKNAFEWAQTADLDGGCSAPVSERSAKHDRTAVAPTAAAAAAAAAAPGGAIVVGQGRDSGAGGGCSAGATSGITKGTIASSREGVRGSQYFARFFVSECRKSAAVNAQLRRQEGTCSVQDMEGQLIYTHRPPMHMNSTNGLGWVQTYFFP